MARRWRLAALVPMQKPVPAGEDGGLPSKLTPIERFPVGGAMFGDTRLVSCIWQESLPPGWDLFMVEPGALLYWVEAETSLAALATIEPYIDYTLDSLSFQTQQALRVGCLDIIDVTPPVQIGDTREHFSFPFPRGYQQRKLASSVHMGVLHAAIFPTLPKECGIRERQVQRAFDWYIKSLHANTDADQYILLWITLEILVAKQAPKVAEPTRLRCGHEIATCPDCSKDTSSFRQRATLEGFLGQFGLTGEDIAALWKMRQIVHGAFGFDEADASELARLAQVLRAVVLSSLKIATGMDPQEPPIMGFGGPAFGSNAGIGGEKQITKWDIAYEDRSPVDRKGSGLPNQDSST